MAKSKKEKKMEIGVEFYGQMIFSNAFIQEGYARPEHWESIMEEARPHIDALLALNEKMTDGGYEITGIPDKSGKRKLDKYKRMEIAQNKAWLVTADKLVEGDLIWLTRLEPEMHIGEHEPCHIEISNKGVSIITDSWGEEVLLRLGQKEEVLRAPKDYAEREDYYTSDEYWLEKAKELGI
jgi:hypothetical protein